LNFYHRSYCKNQTPGWERKSTLFQVGTTGDLS